MSRATEADQKFEEMQNQVFVWAYRLLGNPHDAQDVVQDVFLKWNRQCREVYPSQPRGWLRRVTVNRAVDVFRSRKPAEQTLEFDEIADRCNEQNAFDADMLRKDVSAALERLSELQRSVVVAKTYDGLTFAEIAAEQELAVSTVKTHYLRAVHSLASSLRSRWADDGAEAKELSQKRGSA